MTLTPLSVVLLLTIISMCKVSSSITLSIAFKLIHKLFRCFHYRVVYLLKTALYIKEVYQERFEINIKISKYKFNYLACHVNYGRQACGGGLLLLIRYWKNKIIQF
ncbi:hypothetical protein BpHYR1_011136 [Brachionus plicatilis]|uniref:Secreted protein n=1 Tax=Brachionus plicatilis TaxID=10195 RepID=A0A3M7S841_BRAPC|nr:hypothetical protein BpHYR1_011136 [Brachionus plicatilis]